MNELDELEEKKRGERRKEREKGEVLGGNVLYEITFRMSGATFSRRAVCNLSA